MTDAEIKAQLKPLEVLALTGYGEARNQGLEGLVAVLCVPRNRLKVGQWGDDYKAVCLARWQFSCWEPKGGPDDPKDADELSENYEVVMDAARNLLRGQRGPVLGECLYLAAGVMSTQIRDVTKGSVYYVTHDLWITKPPKHLKGRTPMVRIGDHVFFTAT